MKNICTGLLLPKIKTPIKTNRAMKLTCALLFAASFGVFATGNAQTMRVNIQVENVSTGKVLSEIEKQTDYLFIYNKKEVDLKRKTSVNAVNKTTAEVLSTIFDGTDVIYAIEGENIMLMRKEQNLAVVPDAVQQDNKITGTVLDPTGMPVIGANIMIKGTTNGTITDMDGKFSLDVPKDATLVVTYVGYTNQEISVGNHKALSITLKEDSEALDELVVIGYGSVKKSNLTSSVSKITDEAVSSRPISTVSEALQGQLAGVRSQATSGLPGSNYSIQIRGVNTINGDSSPLYVIDGVPRDDMNDLNANDIASIQILKDASATSIYGSRGANGVVLIETKMGTGRPTLTFDAYYGFQTAEKNLDMMDADEWIALNMYQRNLAHLMNGGKMSDPMSSRSAENRIPDSWYTNTINTDWQDAIMRTAPIQSYNASASAKGDIGNVYFSAGYLNQDGIVKETYYEKMNIRLNAMMNISNKLRVGVNMDASSSNQDTKNAEQKEGAIHKALMISPLVRLDQNTQEWGFIEDAGNSSNYVNPLETLNNLKAQTKYLRLNANIWGEYDILPELKFKTQYSYNYIGNTYEYFCPANITDNNKTSGNSYSQSIGKWTVQNTLSYDKIFAESHHLNILLGPQVSDLDFEVEFIA